MKAIALIVAGAAVGAIVIARMERRYMVETILGGSAPSRDVLFVEVTDDSADTIDWREA